MTASRSPAQEATPLPTDAQVMGRFDKLKRLGARRAVLQMVREAEERAALPSPAVGSRDSILEEAARVCDQWIGTPKTFRQDCERAAADKIGRQIRALQSKSSAPPAPEEGEGQSFYLSGPWKGSNVGLAWASKEAGPKQIVRWGYFAFEEFVCDHRPNEKAVAVFTFERTGTGDYKLVAAAAVLRDTSEEKP